MKEQEVVILHFTGPSDDLGTGIVDYCKNLVDAQRRKGEKSYYVISNSLANQDKLKDDKFIIVDSWGSVAENERQLEKIEQRFYDSDVVWYVHLAPPFCGTIVSPEWFKERAVVGRVHECKIPEKFDDLDARERASYKFEKVVEYVKTFKFCVVSNAGEIKRLGQEGISVLNMTQAVPPNLDPRMLNVKIKKLNKANVLVHFGMIRGKKGIDKVFEVQRIFDSQTEGVKISTNLCGSVSAKECGAFIDVLTQIYERQEIVMVLKDTEFEGLFSQNINQEEIVSQAAEIVSILNQRGVKRLVEVEFYPNASEEQIFELLAKSKVAYLPFDRGATLHSGSLPTCILSDVAVVTTVTGETPEVYRNNLCIVTNATEAAHKIRSLIENPGMLQEQLGKQKILKGSYPTWEKVAHESIYMVYNVTLESDLVQKQQNKNSDPDQIERRDDL